LRSVWTITTKAYPEAHFATFPPEIPERCIRLGTSEKGCCPECGAPWRRIVEKPRPGDNKGIRETVPTQGRSNVARPPQGAGVYAATTIGWEPTCACGRKDTVPCVVLDPCAGAGTTLLVARQNGRRSIGFEINPEYVEQARKRAGQIADITTDPGPAEGEA
jgi:hypothetical protein